MHEVIEAKRDQIGQLCRALPVHRLDVFGSAVGDSFDVGRSDVDVLVEFDEGTDVDRFAAYFGRKEGLERILGRSVDIVTVGSIRNPYVRQQVFTTRETLYAA